MDIPVRKSLIFFGLLESPCLPHGGDSGPPIRAAHIGSGVAMLEPDDSLDLCLDFYGYLGSAYASGARAGEPLGAGGKPSLYYNQWLYKDEPADRAHLEKPSLSPGFEDFSYIPIWQPNQAELRLQYRFSPRVWGSLSLGYSDDPVQTEADDAVHAPLLEELLVKWAPQSVPGTAFSMGSLDVTGAYCPLFDRFPLEHFDFEGVQAEIYGSGWLDGTELMLAAGTDLLGRMKRPIHPQTQDLSDPNTSTMMAGQRRRTVLLASLHHEWAGGFRVGALGGYQSLPEDSTLQMPVTAALLKYRWKASHGWLAGVEAEWSGPHGSQHFTMAYGNGDVKMAWSGPDPVSRIDRTPPDVEWSRQGSSLAQAFYWGDWSLPGNAHLDWAAWMQWRNPAQDTAYPYASGRLGADSVATLRSERFRALRIALDPSIPAFRICVVGIRYDGFFYLDPMAHSNTQELQTDPALRGIPDPASPDSLLLFGPSKWDREAVDSHVFSPYFQMDPGGDFHVRASYSQAWYRVPVWRQGEVADRHGNFVLAAWVNYRFPG